MSVGTLTIDNWIDIFWTVLLLSGIGVSLFLGLRSLRQTRDIQKDQHKHTLLREVIEWATAIFQHSVENGPNICLEDTGCRSDFVRKLESMQAKNEYIVKAARTLGLKQPHQLARKTDNYLASLRKIPASFERRNKKETELPWVEDRKELEDTALDVIKEVATLIALAGEAKPGQTAKMEERDEARISEIHDDVRRIGELIKRSERRSDAKFNFSVGLFAVALSLTFILVVPNFVSGVVLFIGGAIGVAYGVKQYLKSKSAS